MDATQDMGTFGRYLLVEELATGGMGSVYRAILRGAPGFEKQVALKRILKDLSQDEEFVARFADEARIASTLNHGNIVQVFDFGEINGEYYLAMEFVDGPDLGGLIDAANRLGQKIPVPAAIYIIAEFARGLGAAHRRRKPDGNPNPVVHRDVSPQNVLVSRDGEVKVTDFGIAKAADRARRTRTGMLMGKVRYMAPEQARAEDIDARADVFSAAAVLFEAITGRHLIEGRAPEEILLNIVNGRFPRLSEVAQGIPVGLDAIMDRATEQDRSLRYTDGGALARDLERLLHVIAPAFSRDDLASLVQSLVPKSPPQNHEPTRPVLTEDALAAYPTIPEGDVSQVADIPPGIDAINLPAARTRSLASVGGADLAYGHTDLAYGPTLPPSDVPGDNPNNDDPYAAALRAELGASVNDDRPSAAAGSISIPATGKGPYPTATREGASDDRDMSLSAVVARAQQSQEPPGPDHPDVEFLLNPRPPTLIHDRRRERRSPEALGTAPPRRRRLLAAAAVALLLGPAAGFVASRVYRNARPQNANLTHLPEVALPQGKPIALAPTWTLAIQGAKRPHNSQGHAHQIIDVALRHAKAATPPRLGSVFALLDAQGLHPALFWYPRKDGSLRLVFPLPVGHGPLRLRLRATAPGGARAFSVIP